MNLPKPGNPAPSFTFEKLLQAPEGTPLRLVDFLGSVVVLEFWATTCQPCVDAIPHLNDLVVAARGQPIRFLAVTPEEEWIVRTFLRRQRFDCWIALDGVSICARDWFGIRGVPTVILINREGCVAAVAHPRHLRLEHLVEVAETGHSSLPEPAVREVRTTEEAGTPPGPTPMFQVSISSSVREPEPSTAYNSWKVSDNRCLFIGHRADIESAIRQVFELEAGQLKTEVAWPRGEYSFLLHTPQGSSAALRQAFASALQASFGLYLKPIEVECDVAVLTALEVAGPGLRPAHPLSRPGGGESRGQLILNGLPWGALQKYLVKWLAVPVIDETGLAGRYDLRMKWKPSNADLLLTECDPQAVRALLGRSPVDHSAPEVARFVAAARGTLAEHAFAEMTAEMQERALLFRAKLERPNDAKFLPDTAEICRSLERDLGLQLNAARRKLPGYVVQTMNNQTQHS